MKLRTVIVSSIAVTTLATSSQSCVAVATSSIGMSIIKKVLLGGIQKGVSIFGNKTAFLENDLITKAIPINLQSTYQLLDKIAPNLTTQGKNYVAEAAAYTVNLSEPILNNAVNNLTAEDITRIAQGESGTATKILKEKTATQISVAILPKVNEKLNEFGIAKAINNALKGSNLLGSFLGSKSESVDLGTLASEQLVNGLFNIIEQHEKQNSSEILNLLRKN